jgi:hypothetical protein
VVEVLGSADVVDGGQVLLQVVGHVVEELALVDRARGPALGARAVVRDHHDQRVLVFAQLLEEPDQLADVVIGVLEEAREHLHHPRVEPALVGRELRPVLHVGVVARELRVLGDDPHGFLLLEHLLAVGVPAGVEHTFVLVGPFLRHLVRRMHGAGAEVHEERLVGRHLLGVGDHRPGLLHQVGREVIALLGRLLRLDLRVVAHELGVVLVRVAAEEAVVALEAATERPAVVRPRGRRCLGRRQVPLAEGVRVVAVLEQDLGQHPVLERHVAIAARVSRGALGDARHGVRVVVAPGEHARARR